MSFQSRLKELRKHRKLTQEELGNVINVTKVSISGYENGNRTPDTETLQKLADFFEVSVDYLLGRSEAPVETEGVSKGNFFYFDKEGLTDEDLEYLKQSVEIMKERARKRAAEKRKDNNK
jgi:transcriptional regulator with XRE-family HTH domain